MERWNIFNMDRSQCKLERQWTVGTCCTWTGHNVSLTGNGPLEGVQGGKTFASFSPSLQLHAHIYSPLLFPFLSLRLLSSAHGHLRLPPMSWDAHISHSVNTASHRKRRWLSNVYRLKLEALSSTSVLVILSCQEMSRMRIKHRRWKLFNFFSCLV